MKVLGVVGSPRKGGNTDILVTEALRGAASAGAEVERVFLPDHDVRPCTACDDCRVDGECILPDDMGALLAKVYAADAWVLGTPVYWWGPSAQFKAFLDRWYAAVHHKELKARLRKRMALVCPYGDEDPATPRHVVGMLEDACRYLRAEFVAQLLVTADAKGEVAANPKAMAEAFALGVKMAEG